MENFALKASNIKYFIMAQNITISRTAGTRALLTALFAIVVLLVTRTVKNVLTVLKTSRQWQFVGYNFIAVVVAILLCIEYE